MLFNSYAFIFLFLPITLAGFFTFGRYNIRLAASGLALASVIFYGYWSVTYLWLLLISIGLNYQFAVAIANYVHLQKSKTALRLFQLAVLLNLLVLGYYKYSQFFIQAIDDIGGMGWHFPRIVLPLGISFFTFTQIAFLADTLQGKVRRFDFLHYFLFITYFPHLIAGPILHHESVIPQFQKKETYVVNWGNVATGTLLFTVGLFKKVFWADSLAPFADSFFSAIEKGMVSGALPTVYEAWAGALAYTLQIYFDFSGYTDMALGIALMFNTRLPINFDSPYKSTSIIEFWRRWHISLSTFLRDYLYIPLGGKRGGSFQRYRNLLATMLIGGLWHGAGWTFVVWGALHGTLLVINHLWRALPMQTELTKLPNGLKNTIFGAATFMAVVVAWVFFRSTNFDQAMVILLAMASIAENPISFDLVANGHLLVLTQLDGKLLAELIVSGLAWVWLLPNSNHVHFRDHSSFLLVVQITVTALVLCLAINRFGSYSPFLYYQF